MAVMPVPGSERFEVADKRADELDISPRLALYEAGPTEVDPVTYEVVFHKLIQINDDTGMSIRKGA